MPPASSTPTVPTPLRKGLAWAVVAEVLVLAYLFAIYRNVWWEGQVGLVVLVLIGVGLLIPATRLIGVLSRIDVVPPAWMKAKVFVALGVLIMFGSAALAEFAGPHGSFVAFYGLMVQAILFLVATRLLKPPPNARQ